VGPRAAGAVEAQQQLAQAMAGAHQVTADVLAGAHEITQRLLVERRDADRVPPADHQQPQQSFGVTAIGLDVIAGRALVLPGAAMTQPTPTASSARASPNPVRPAS
jgi:hypothetical protein